MGNCVTSFVWINNAFLSLLEHGVCEITFLASTPALSMVECSRDEHGSRLKPIITGTGLDRTAIFFKIAGSGLDRTEKIFMF